MEHGTRSIQRLEFVLNVERSEYILGISDGQMRRIGIVRRFALLRRGNDVGILRNVVLGETVAGGLGGGRFEVIQVAVFDLIVAEPFPHVVQYVHGEFLSLGVGEVLSEPFGVQAAFVHADQTDSREVVVERGKVSLGIREQSVLEQFGDDFALYFQRTRGNIHHLVETGVKVALVLGKIPYPRHIDRNDADGAGRFARTEETARFFPEFSEVEAQSAAHAADVAGLHVGVDVVGKIRSAVFGGHLEQQFVVLGLRPVEVPGNRVSGNGILEASAVGVALYHGFDKRFVYHIHFLFAVLVLEVHLLAADYRVQLGEVVGYRPVQSYVRKRRLRAPAAGDVHAVNEALNGFFDLVVAEVVDLDERSEIGIERTERLRARPFVLHYAEEVDHLVAKRGEVFGGRRRDLPGNAAQTFLDKLL